MMRQLILFILCVTISTSYAWGARNISLPHTEDFSASDSLDDIINLRSDNGADVTRVQGSWRGSTDYVARIDPPTIAAAGGGINGGDAGLGAFHFTATNTINIAFALNIGTTYSSSAANAGGSLINKFIDIFGATDRSGLLGLNDRGTRDSHEFGLFNSSTEDYWYQGATEPSLTSTRAGVYFDDGDDGPRDLAGQWIWINYAVNHTTGDVILRVWDRDGNYSGTHFEIPNATNMATTRVDQIGGYYNEYHPTADTNSRLLIDDITISSDTSSIDPPAGFITSGDPINGACGTNNGGTFPTLASGTTGNCATGTVASFSGTGPWTWSCAGSNGGTTASCSASLQAVGGGTGRAPYSATARVPYSATKFARYYEATP